MTGWQIVILTLGLAWAFVIIFCATVIYSISTHDRRGNSI